MSRPATADGYGCAACIDAELNGYCAPTRCYCGHPACPAFDSWHKPTTDTVRVPKAGDNRHQAKSWAERDEPTWLDK